MGAATEYAEAMISLKQSGGCAWRALTATIRHDGVEHAGYLAFLNLLALFPFLVFIVAVIGFIGQGEAGAAFITSLLLALPADITAALKPRIVEIISGPPQGLLTVSILGAIWTASSAVEGLRTILNRAYHVHTPPAYWFRRSLSVLQLLFFTFLAVTGMLLVVAIPLAVRHVEDWLGVQFSPAMDEEWSRIAYAASVGVLFLTIAGMYYTIPNIRQRLVSVVPGALVVTFAWLAAAWALTLYLSNFQQVNLIYGSLGSIIVALIFFYICNIIFIFGAELNYQIVHCLGLHIVEREHVDAVDFIE
ncbi:MAG: YihY/virulence factor BrkB family protein [Pseudomonadota bacterium]|nr:YihY/virulence factor BrkB family protein [Pseudomonadota bacterium]